MSGHDIFYQWASYLTTIKNEGGQAGKVAKHMLVSLWGRLYSDGRRPGPHRRMAPFISAKGRKIISKKIRPLGECVKRIHTDGYIISGKATDQMLGQEYAVNKQWYYNARRLIWQKIVLTGISGTKFTKALSKETKSNACSQVLGLKFIGEINIEPDVYISEVCKACPNLQWLSFENCGSRILNNKNLEALLVEYPNLKSLVIRGSRRLSPKTITKIPKLAPSLEMIVIRECLRIRKDILTDFQDLYPKTKLIFKAILFENDIRRMQNMAFFSDKLKNQEERWEAMKEGHVHHTVKALIDTTSCSNFISKSSCWGVRSLAPYENLIVNAFITLLRC
ncbi:hypothetical protein RhiirA4_475832 [Rhizophagus irregularis]|uniref:Uncharacterized protein n=3 Tax=Rhizophagus irregularis TaxID=588596 RepID=A0A2I1HAN5_9GLOM|nr:hypothetical protein RhiirA4_475832 [Rhizophagus irregularis]